MTVLTPTAGVHQVHTALLSAIAALRSHDFLSTPVTTPVIEIAWCHVFDSLAEATQRAPWDVTLGVGRHDCAVSDGGGTHFRDEFGRMAFLQQLLHAVSLAAVDLSRWRETLWYQRRFSEVSP